jgi:hypothetical protein
VTITCFTRFKSLALDATSATDSRALIANALIVIAVASAAYTILFIVLPSGLSSSSKTLGDESVDSQSLVVRVTEFLMTH